MLKKYQNLSPVIIITLLCFVLIWGVMQGIGFFYGYNHVPKIFDVITTYDTSSPHFQKEIDNIISSVNQEIPKDLPIKRIAVNPMKDDPDQVVTRSLFRALSNNPRFTLLDRNYDHHKKIISEYDQSLILTPEDVQGTSPNIPAEALFFGEVTKFSQFLGVTRINFNLKFIKVSNSEIIKTWDNKSVEVKTPFGEVRLYIFLLLLFVIFMINMITRNIYAEKQDKLDQAEGNRQTITRKLMASDEILDKTQQECLEKKNNSDTPSKKSWEKAALLAKELREDLNLLNNEITNSEYGDVDDVTYKDAKKLAKFENKLSREFNNIFEAAEKFRSKLKDASDPEKVSEDNIKEYILSARMHFRERKNFLN